MPLTAHARGRLSASATTDVQKLLNIDRCHCMLCCLLLWMAQIIAIPREIVHSASMAMLTLRSEMPYKEQAEPAWSGAVIALVAKRWYRPLRLSSAPARLKELLPCYTGMIPRSRKRCRPAGKRRSPEHSGRRVMILESCRSG